MRLLTDEQHAQIVAHLNSVEPECGYGYYRPANPHNFQPDYECCSLEEIAAHKAACDAYTRGEYTPDRSDGWVSPELHILRAPWGIGAYQVAPQGITEALATLTAAPNLEVVAWVFKPHKELLWPNEVEAKNPLELNSFMPLYALKKETL